MNALSMQAALASPLPLRTPAAADVDRAIENDDLDSAFEIALSLPGDGTREKYARQALVSRILRSARNKNDGGATIARMFAKRSAMHEDLFAFMDKRLVEIMTEGKRFVPRPASAEAEDPPSDRTFP